MRRVLADRAVVEELFFEQTKDRLDERAALKWAEVRLLVRWDETSLG